MSVNTTRFFSLTRALFQFQCGSLITLFHSFIAIICLTHKTLRISTLIWLRHTDETWWMKVTWFVFILRLLLLLYDKKMKLFYSRLFCALINCEILWKALKIPFWMRKLLFEHSFFLLLLLLLLNTTMTMTKSKILHAHCWKHDKVFIFVRWNVCDILTAVEISLFFSLTGFSMFVSILICIIYFQLEK